MKIVICFLLMAAAILMGVHMGEKAQPTDEPKFQAEVKKTNSEEKTEPEPGNQYIFTLICGGDETPFQMFGDKGDDFTMSGSCSEGRFLLTYRVH